MTVHRVKSSGRCSTKGESQPAERLDNSKSQSLRDYDDNWTLPEPTSNRLFGNVMQFVHL